MDSPNGHTKKIMNDVRYCFTQAKITERFWNYAIRHIVDARNTVPHYATRGISFSFRLRYDAQVFQAHAIFPMSREVQTQGKSAHHIWFLSLPQFKCTP